MYTTNVRVFTCTQEIENKETANAVLDKVKDVNCFAQIRV